MRQCLQGLIQALGEAKQQQLEEKVEKILQRFNTSRTPGSDGLPKEFYVTFWDLVGTDLLELFQERLQKGRLGAWMDRGLVTLLHEKSSKTELKNWRPITLLNFDYKLLAKVLAK
ncbi:hypothetical protein Y1Q_0006261 [Alligator mississippiensis]|uniref:Reverse transcriptase domain-containing protein n=1 Tax=Alligator mississippiensis TaxID=8496 RepID=A0A151NYE6_ALLMI|nr:hypothetical protein Y1Q_0006261 [Alligator mississippiensis]